MSIELNHGTGIPSHAIIWLHGLGASCNDFPTVVPHLGLNPSPAIRFIFPQAPDRPITVNGGISMPGWYDIKGMTIEGRQDREGIEESSRLVNKLIDEQIAQGISTENIILAGFSQGGAIAYYTALRTQHPLAGVLTMSTYMVFTDQLAEERSLANQNTPFFASHGSRDPVVDVDLGEHAIDTLKAQGYTTEWKTYPMEHQVVMDQIQDIGTWINRCFSQA